MAADEYDDHGGHGAHVYDHDFFIGDPNAVLNARLHEIVEASLFFAWLDSRECFGTIAEIGYYQRGDGGVCVVAAPQWDRELWFACAMADIFIKAPSASEAWKRLWKGENDGIPVIQNQSENERIWNHA